LQVHRHQISTFGTILTSPTLYISYRSVFASDGCSAIGPTLYNTIVPIPLASPLSSVFGGTIPCDDAHGANGFTQVWTATAPFNVTDLNSPVPFSIYSSAPWCATYQYEHGCNRDCPTTDAYKPIIVVPEGVLQKMNPAWASCYGDIRGVYDPPIALTQVASVDVPQMTGLASVSSEAAAAGATPASSPSKPATETGGAEALPDNLPSNSVAGSSSSTPQVSSQIAGSSQDHSGADVPAVLPDNLPAPGVGSNALRASRSSGSNGDVGNIVAAILGGSASSKDDESSSSDRLSEIGGPEEHPNTSPLSSNIAPYGSQASGSFEDVGGSFAAILGGAESPTKEANSASASQASSNEVAAGYPSSSGGTAGDNEQQASRLSALDQDVGDVVADVLGGGSGRLPGTGASVSRAPQGVFGNEWDSPATSTFDADDSSHEALDTMLGSGRPDQTPTAQVSEGQAFATSHSSPYFSGEHGSGASLGLLSDIPTTTFDNESGVNEPISTQGSSVDAKASADSSDSTADSSSTGTALFASDRLMTFGILMIVTISSVLVL
jgi:hypothetical protein